MALKKLRNKLLMVNLISLSLVVAIAFSIIYINFYNRAQNEIEKAISSIPPGVLENVLLLRQSGSISLSLGQDTDNTITISGEPRLPVDYSKSFVINIMNDGSITAFSMLDMDNDVYLGAIESVAENETASGYLTIADRTWRYNLEPGSPFVSYQYSIVFLDVEDTNRGLGALAASLFVIGIISVVAILLISLHIANRAILPVEESITGQRRFVADASHELKTPIAIIAANAEAANNAVLDAYGDERVKSSDISKWIGNIADEAQRMGGLVENLLVLAKAEEKRIDHEMFDLITSVYEETNRVEAFLFENNIEFVIDHPQNGALNVRSDRMKVKAALSVLLENAVKYTPIGGRVVVTVGNTKAGAYISVSNTGAFIPSENLSLIFERFYRSDPSRNSETGGHGIGLSIANEIARSLGGALTAVSVPRPEGGAVNTFTLLL